MNTFINMLSLWHEKIEKTTESESYDKSRKIILFLPAEGLI